MDLVINYIKINDRRLEIRHLGVHYFWNLTNSYKFFTANCNTIHPTNFCQNGTTLRVPVPWGPSPHLVASSHGFQVCPHLRMDIRKIYGWHFPTSSVECLPKKEGRRFQVFVTKVPCLPVRWRGYQRAAFPVSSKQGAFSHWILLT